MPQSDALAIPQSSEGRSLKLYELTGLYAELNESMANPGIMQTDGTPLEEGENAFVEMLEVITKDIATKGDKVAMVIRQVEAEAEWLEHQAEQYENEAERIRARAGVRTNNAKRVRKWLANALAMLGDDTQKIAGPVLTVTLSKKSESNRVEIVEEDDIPSTHRVATLKMSLAHAHENSLEEFITSIGVDKKGLNELFKDTGVLPKGTEPAEVTRNLKIY